MYCTRESSRIRVLYLGSEIVHYKNTLLIFSTSSGIMMLQGQSLSWRSGSGYVWCILWDNNHRCVRQSTVIRCIKWVHEAAMHFYCYYHNRTFDLTRHIAYFPMPLLAHFVYECNMWHAQTSNLREVVNGTVHCVIDNTSFIVYTNDDRSDSRWERVLVWRNSYWHLQRYPLNGDVSKPRPHQIVSEMNPRMKDYNHFSQKWNDTTVP